MAETDLISRQAAIDAVNNLTYPSSLVDVKRILVDLPSAQPERMTNRQWIDFLSAQFDISRTSAFDISRTSAKEMLHGMMQWKKEDNFKKLFNGGQDSRRFNSIRKELK